MTRRNSLFRRSRLTAGVALSVLALAVLGPLAPIATATIAQPTSLETSISIDGANPGVLGGTTLSDTATLSCCGEQGETITFNLYGPFGFGVPSDCTGTPVFTTTGSLNSSLQATTSSGFSPTVQGTYTWQASYPGDDFGLPSKSLCTDIDESATVLATAAQVQPDGIARRPGAKPRGVGVYNNTDPTRQIAYVGNRSYEAGTYRSVYLYVRNNGTLAAQYKITSAGDATPGYVVKYRRASGADLTSQVEGGGFLTPTLQPGEKYGIVATIKVTAAAAPGSELSRVVTIAAVLATLDVADTVGFSIGRR